jgi:hypothetical protein
MEKAYSAVRFLDVGYDHLSTMTTVKDGTRSTLLPSLLSSFVSHFTRAIRQEMEAMRERRGSFEVVLTDGERNVLDTPEGGASYTFRALSLDEKLVGASNAPCARPTRNNWSGSIASTVSK